MGVKTVKKASAKRKSPVKKRVPPLVSRMDRLEEAMVSMAGTIAVSEAMLAKKIAAVSETVNETSHELRQTTKELSERVDKTSEAVDKLSERVDRTSATVDKLSERVDKTSATVDKMSERVDKVSESVAKLNGNVGGINNSLGKVVELVLLPGLMENLNTQFGYRFDNISPNKIFTDSGNMYAEIDLFLENGDAVMAVEAKTRVRESEMNTFLKSLSELRQHEAKAGVAGKTIYAAVAGISFDNNARKLAVANGMYLVELDHSNDRIKIEPPAEAVGKW
ncbi:MAG: hypothetical protein LBB74_07980 [Chitinispirillales bacterium]|nr:hypothetical protein [Chitinispirillales bacterium]